MKKILLAAGILCALGVPVAQAQNYAVSDAVKNILDRADAGITASSQQGVAGLMLNTAFGEWSRMMLGPVVKRIDTRLQVITRAREGMERTACFQMDLTLMEAKMEQVRGLINAAVDARRIDSMQRMSVLFFFLDGRYRLLADGGTDRSVTDWDWQLPYAFDTSVPEPGPVCYYHSDYTPPGFMPPSRNGYGCDEETLSRLLNEWGNTPAGGAFPVMQEELQRERAVTAALEHAGESYLDDMRLMADTPQEIEDIAAGDLPSAAATAAPREHFTESGCGPAPSIGVVTNSLKGSFSVSRYEIRAATGFRDMRRNSESARRIPVGLALSDDPAGWMWNVFKGTEQRLLRVFTRKQAVQEANTFMASADVALSTERGMQEANVAITRLGNLTRNMSGIRGFTRDFAFYLLRSCVERPCQERLERVLAMIFENECFPYFSGAYLTDSPANPRWEKCAEAAGIEP